MIPDILFEHIWCTAIKSTLKDLVLFIFCDQRNKYKLATKFVFFFEENIVYPFVQMKSIEKFLC